MGEGSLKSSYYVDNFKHPYIRLNQTFAWPSIHLVETSMSEIEAIRSILVKYWPGFDSSFGLWQNDIFSGNQKTLSFVYQNDQLQQSEMMIELRVLIGYAGGAESNEIHGVVQQDRSPEFLTNRIYFRLLLMPVEKIKFQGNRVRDIDLLTFTEILEASNYSMTREYKELWTTALFDSIDYSFLQERIKSSLDKVTVWKLGNVFMPILIERMTFALNILTIQQAIQMAEPFRELIHLILKENLADLESKEIWRNYINGWTLERTLSRSGNPHWHFVNYPIE